MKRLLFTHGADIDGMGNAILAKLAFEKYFPNIEIQGVPVESEVSAQPVNEEIFQGASPPSDLRLLHEGLSLDRRHQDAARASH